MKISSKIVLTPYESDYWPYLQKWRGDSYYQNYFRNMPMAFTSQDYQEFPKVMNLNLMMVTAPELQCVVGMVTWDNVRFIPRTCDMGMLIDKEFKGRGMCLPAHVLLLKHLFLNLGFHKVSAKALEGDENVSLKLKRGGFEFEGLERDHVFLEGDYKGEERYSLLDHEFKTWLKQYEKGAFPWLEEKAEGAAASATQAHKPLRH